MSRARNILEAIINPKQNVDAILNFRVMRRLSEALREYFTKYISIMRMAVLSEREKVTTLRSYGASLIRNLNSAIPPTEDLIFHFVPELTGHPEIVAGGVLIREGQKPKVRIAISLSPNPNLVLDELDSNFHESLGKIRGAIYHELVHLEQKKRDKTGWIYGPSTIRKNRTEATEYYGQPAEVMAHAVQVGKLLQNPRTFDSAATIIHNYAEQTGGLDSPTMKRFNKNLTDYLRTQGWSDEKIRKAINRFYTLIRRSLMRKRSKPISFSVIRKLVQ